MVPTSIEGMETEIWRSPFTLHVVSTCLNDFGAVTYLFMIVMQLEDSTTCAGSCPVAR
jgi:hypothetical protein